MKLSDGRFSLWKIRAAYFFLIAFEGFVAMGKTMAFPSDPKRAWLLGYSFPRWLLFFFFLMAGFASLGLALSQWQNRKRARRFVERIFAGKKMEYLAFALFLISVTVLLIPLYRFGRWSAYAERLSLLFWWTGLLGIQAFFLMRFERRRKRDAKQEKKGNFLRAFFPDILTFLLFIAVWAEISRTKMGILPKDAVQWKDIGVPLLPGQVWGAFWGSIVVIVFLYALRSFIPYQWVKHNADILAIFSIWGIAALLWAFTPLPRNFFFPGPYPPNHTIYPFGDSAAWDIYGQYALIGQGFANGNVFADHNGFAALLASLHIFLGQDYVLISAVFAALLAIFPAILYKLGKEMRSPLFGLFLAILAIVHELNAFASSTALNLSHPRFLLTEFPTAVALAAVTLWLFLWLRDNPRVRIAYAMPIGGALALLIFFRFNTLGIPFAVMAGVAVVFGRDWKKTLLSWFWLFFSMALVLSPWMGRSWASAGSPFFFAASARHVFDEGFRIRPPTPTPSPSTTSYERIPPERRSLFLPKVMPRFRFSEPMLSPSVSPESDTESRMAASILNHVAHNIVASVLVLPTNLQFHDLHHTLYDIHPYWGKGNGTWTGELSFTEALFLGINVLLLAIGVGFSWRKWKLAGLVPLGIFLAYDLSAALARTSGGRYIVPMSWVVLLYFALGLVELFGWGAARFGFSEWEPKDSFDASKAFPWKKALLFFLPFLLFTSAMLIVDRAMPRRYSNWTKEETLNLLIEENLVDETGFSEDELREFLSSPDAQAFFGRGLYPRYYGIGEGEHTSYQSAYSPKDFPRLGITFIGPFGARQAILPLLESPSYFPQAEDVLVIGCKGNSTISAVLIAVFGENKAVYVRDPVAPLECPMPEPVCETWQSCH